MSIRLRLTLAYAAALGAVLVTVGVIIWVQLGRDLRSSLEDALQVQASDVAGDYDSDTAVSLAVRDSGRIGIFTVIYAADGSVERSSTDAPSLASTPAVGVSEAVVNGHRYALYGVAGRNGAQIVAGSSLGEVDRAADVLGTLQLVVGVVAGLAALAGAWWIAGVALAPMSIMGRELAAIGVGDLGQRVTQPDQQDEVGRLAKAVNSMLGRIDEGVRRQQAFVAAASHDLRTPIAALRTELELAERGAHTPEELAAAIHAAHGDALRLGNLANDLLILAEAEPGGRALLRRAVSARALVESCVADQAALADRHSINVFASAPNTKVFVDRSRLEQAIRNLLANALRFGPSGSTVEISAQVQPGRDDHAARTLEVTVADRGPGVVRNLRAALFLPFSARADGEHSGLGLAVAAAAVRAHGGAIEYSDRPGGGALFRFSVPC
jgi:two-component system, OmpR family, sensor kinase